MSETVWPHADFIIGNPSFLGAKRLRTELGDEYVEHLYRAYGKHLPGSSDLCCYFFERARQEISKGKTTWAGLLATNSIRKGGSNQVLKQIKQSGDIFMAWSDEPWVLDGASIRISIVGFGEKCEAEHVLDGAPVTSISSDLTPQGDLSNARVLQENLRLSFRGIELGGPFELTDSLAQHLMSLPTNPNGRPNSDVISRWATVPHVLGRPTDSWIIDFGPDMTEADASLYEEPFEHALRRIRPERTKNRASHTALHWWTHRRPAPPLRQCLKSVNRYLATPLVSKHRLFAWIDARILPVNRLVVFCRNDDYFFGALHSRAHEIWSLRVGARQGGERPTYNNSTCFETFPLPWPPGTEPVDDPRVIAIGEAAERLNELRENWLNPKGASEAELKKRTLTNLYNTRPQWLQNAHATLDRAVWAAYGWDDLDPATVDEDTILSRLLALNLERSDSPIG